jgi:type I restriction enzyme S subunit
LIEVNRRRIALLDEMGRRLFEEAVVCVIGELPQPNSAAHPKHLPNGWKVERLTSVAKIVMGQSPPSSELNTEAAGLVFHQGVTNFGELFPGRRVFCDYLENKRIAEQDDILFSVRAPVGRINCAVERTMLGRGVAAVRPNSDERAYLLSHLRATFYETDLIGNGAIYRSVTKADMERVPIVWAPPTVRARLNSQLAPVFLSMHALWRSNSILAASRDLLLPRLISGELSVASAERELEAAE